MRVFYISWLVSIVVLLIVAIVIGRRVKGHWYGILIDRHGRISLSRSQASLWTLIVLSLISGVFFARLITGVSDPLEFAIPDALLAVMGISYGSGAAAEGIKAGKDSRGVHIYGRDEPKFSNLWCAEEGSQQVVDIARLQNTWFTLIIVVAYVLTVVSFARSINTPGDITSLPTFSGTMATLLAISHAGYLGGKLPDHPPTGGAAPSTKPTTTPTAPAPIDSD